MGELAKDDGEQVLVDLISNHNHYCFRPSVMHMHTVRWTVTVNNTMLMY